MRVESVLDFIQGFHAMPTIPRDSLHVDEIAGAPRLPIDTVKFAIDVFNDAVKARLELELSATIALQFFLQPVKSRKRGALDSISDLAKQLSRTPPELILYRGDAAPNWRDDAFAEITPRLAGETLARNITYLQEWQPDDEPGYTDRRVWLVSLA